MLRDAESSSDDSRIAEMAEMDHIDYETVRRYRTRFEFRNEGHVWNAASDDDFLTFLGAAGKDAEGILRPTYAGMLMFSKDCWITRVLPDYFLDYRQETSVDTRWEDRFTSFTGDWSGNIYDFYIKAYNKLKAALRVPFKLEGIERVDDTPAHEALREALVNCLTNADYHGRSGVVCVWRDEALTISNPGNFRIPFEKAVQPGESSPRNATMLKMFAMIDAGERAGSGITKIFHGWKEMGYAEPSYREDSNPDKTILTLPLSEVSAGHRQIRTADINASSSGEKEYSKAGIVQYLTAHGPSKTADIASGVGLGVSWTNELLRTLVSEGIVEAKGNARARRYALRTTSDQQKN